MSNTVNENTIRLSESLKAAMVKGANGSHTVSEEWYAGSLPEGLSMEQRKQFDEHDSAVAAAAALALGQVVLPEMKENPELTEGTLSINLGANRINASVLRDYVNGKETYHGHSIVSYEVNSAGINRGELGLAMTAVRNLADELLG